MERDPEFYRPTKEDDGFKGAPYEWWYADGVFDNGYSMRWLGFMGYPGKPLNPELRHVMFVICDPHGNLSEAFPYFPMGKTAASTQGCDVRFGDTSFRGEAPRFELNFHDGDTGADLVYENVTQGVQEPPDGCFIGRMQVPSTERYLTDSIYPRSRVTGKLIVGGKEIKASGEGYIDHQWGNAPIPEILQFHFWGGSIFLATRWYTGTGNLQIRLATAGSRDCG
jgi:predicted secreted hydrolase